MFVGAYTALVTPFKGYDLDLEGLRKLVQFQIVNGIRGILAVGTTGESPVLIWEEHHKVIKIVAELCRNKCQSIAGTGSNSVGEAFESTKHAVEAGSEAVLLVDPYYNGPSSLEIRREYLAPLAENFPGTEIIPYVIPARTGAQLLPEDLAILQKEFSNVNTIKEATGDLENMKRVRELCGEGFSILSGDDDKTYEMMIDPAIKANGVISVVSNIAPKAVNDMVSLLNEGKKDEGRDLMLALKPLFEIVTVKTKEVTPFGIVTCRARNPLPIKTLMSVLGMPGGGCRKPLGKMTKSGIQVVLEKARAAWHRKPDIFKPLADFFGVDVESRLYDESPFNELVYEQYCRLIL